MNYCPKCGKVLGEATRCAGCGLDTSSYRHLAEAAPLQSRVGGYMLLGCLQRNRQALYYSCINTTNGDRLIAEEFFPSVGAKRARGRAEVTLEGDPELLQRAMDMFQGSTEARLLPLVDTVRANGTVYRFYHPESAGDMSADAEKLADTPILFRDVDDARPLMTINALPIPALPDERKYRPHRNGRRLALGLCIAVLVLALLTAALVMAGRSGQGLSGIWGSTATPVPTATPTAKPTEAPTATPTEEPTATPSEAPTATPTAKPTETPTATPSEAPTATPSEAPTAIPTEEPTVTSTEEPTITPAGKATVEPTEAPNQTITVGSTIYHWPLRLIFQKKLLQLQEQASATDLLVKGETEPSPSAEPAPTATAAPTETPSPEPTPTPTAEPTATPTAEPTATLTAEPTATPTEEPTATPTEEPTATPTEEPTATPTEEPTATPTAEPTATLTAEPTATPEATEAPAAAPTEATETREIVFKWVFNWLAQSVAQGRDNQPVSNEQQTAHPAGEPSATPTIASTATPSPTATTTPHPTQVSSTPTVEPTIATDDLKTPLPGAPILTVTGEVPFDELKPIYVDGQRQWDVRTPETATPSPTDTPEPTPSPTPKPSTRGGLSRISPEEVKKPDSPKASANPLQSVQIAYDKSMKACLLDDGQTEVTWKWALSDKLGGDNPDYQDTVLDASLTWKLSDESWQPCIAFVRYRDETPEALRLAWVKTYPELQSDANANGELKTRIRKEPTGAWTLTFTLNDLDTIFNPLGSMRGDDFILLLLLCRPAPSENEPTGLVALEVVHLRRRE